MMGLYLLGILVAWMFGGRADARGRGPGALRGSVKPRTDPTSAFSRRACPALISTHVGGLPQRLVDRAGSRPCTAAPLPRGARPSAARRATGCRWGTCSSSSRSRGSRAARTGRASRGRAGSEGRNMRPIARSSSLTITSVCRTLPEGSVSGTTAAFRGRLRRGRRRSRRCGTHGRVGAVARDAQASAAATTAPAATMASPFMEPSYIRAPAPPRWPGRRRPGPRGRPPPARAR